MSPNSRQQLFNEESQQCAADQSQVQVVDHEQSVQLQGSALLHELPATEDDGIVGDEEDGGLVEGGQRSDTLDELEFAGRVADDFLKGLVKDGPEVNAEWPIYCRNGEILKDLGCHGGILGFNGYIQVKITVTE